MGGWVRGCVFCVIFSGFEFCMVTKEQNQSACNHFLLQLKLAIFELSSGMLQDNCSHVYCCIGESAVCLFAAVTEVDSFINSKEIDQ